MPAYKVFTHDYCSPIRGGAPVWDGSAPFELPAVPLDTSSAQCAAGWNYVSNVATGLRIAGLWPNGWSARVVEVEPSADAIERGGKYRASSLRIIRTLDDAEIKDAISELSRPFADYADHMAAEQWAWFEALRRPKYQSREVERAVRRALKARDLRWDTKKYDDAWGARGAWGAWDAWGAWGAWDAWDAWGARAARDAWAAWGAWGAWGAWDAWDAWAARAARAALTVNYAATRGWVDLDPELLTKGLRDAYVNGLAVAVPTALNELGWAMVGKEKR